MEKKNFINRVLQNTRRPEGFWGRMILSGMNKGHVDAVTAFETVYFWGDLCPAFVDVARVLKPGGYFLICCEASDPDNKMWTNRIEGMVVHAEEELRQVLLQTGFTDITVRRHSKEVLCMVARKKGI